MKTIFTFGILLLNLSVFAQEAGKAGELLNNEAKTSEMQTQKIEGLRGNNKTFPNTSGTVKPPSSAYKGNSGYRFNYNYGNAEVFLRIPQNGKYTVELDNQMISNSTGKFRFFDLRGGIVPIAIYENNFLIYRTRLSVRNNTRLVLDYFPSQGLYLLGNYPVQNQSYGINEWDDIWNNPYQNQHGSWNGNSGNGNYYNNVLNSQEFNNFMISLKRNASFDKDKIAMISSVSRNTNFSALQIQAMLKEMSFDDNKLEIAKQLYQNCADRRNYYLVFEAFSFESSRRKLQDYISRF
ncbi:DUF4476 domain-containing protein [Chryseobacterium sp. MP_3.2]|uniref:DUF4476 domain-containing protein n=1 Tax=Chryseobacterium sp. MP_3.2 TaxID=3071712 RepID=UPI002DF9F953|nr:hypothetical protein [Chryseobacterium sp. MP_3.2]